VSAGTAVVYELLPFAFLGVLLAVSAVLSRGGFAERPLTLTLLLLSAAALLSVFYLLTAESRQSALPHPAAERELHG
jgi:hypothetical protein